MHWFPGLTFPHSDARVAAASALERGEHLALVGKTGYHPRRQRIFSSLIDAQVPLAWKQVRQSETIAFYASSLIGLNVSMNGDLNLRVFETIAGGAMLMNDQLSPDAGLDDLLAEGREKISYRCPSELVELARHFLTNPAEARAIGEAGQCWFRCHFNERRRRAAFQDLVFNGRDLPEFEVSTAKSRISFGNNGLVARAALSAYDVVNELHRQQEEVAISADETVPAEVFAMAATLPRVRIIRNGEGASHVKSDLHIIGKDNIGPTLATVPTRCWCWNAADSSVFKAKEFSENTRWQLASPDAALLVTVPPPPAPHEKITADSRRHLDAGDLRTALALAQQAHQTSPRSADPLLILAEIAFELGNQPLADKAIRDARAAEADNPRTALLEWRCKNLPLPWQGARFLGRAWDALSALDWGQAAANAKGALACDPSQADAFLILSLASVHRRQNGATASERAHAIDEETKALARAIQLAPQRPELVFYYSLTRLEAGDNAAAEKSLRWMLANDPHASIWAVFSLGRLYQGRNESGLAALAFARGLALEPGHAELRRLFKRSCEKAASANPEFLAQLLLDHSKRGWIWNTEDAAPWLSIICREPTLACIPRVAEEFPPGSGQGVQLALSLYVAAVRTPLPLERHALAHTQVVLMAFQPWFGFDMLEAITCAANRGMLLVLLGEKPMECAHEFGATGPDELRGLVYRGIELGAICAYRIALESRSTLADLDLQSPRCLEVVRRVYSTAATLIDQANDYCDFYRPATIVVAQGYDLVAAALRHVGLQRGLRLVAIENVFHSGLLLWEDICGISVNRHQARNYFWRYRDNVTTEQAGETTARYLASMKQLKSGEHSSPAAGFSWGEAEAGPVIVYLAQVGVDSSVLFGLRDFSSQVEVITALADYAARRACRLVIKLHPKESPGYVDTVPYFRNLTAGWLDRDEGFQAIARRMGGSLVVDRENEFDTYGLIQQADACVTINSQAGLEALLFGKEVVLCGDAYYGSLGFTHEASDGPSLDFALDRLLRDGLVRNKDAECRKFFHIFTEYYCVPKTVQSLLQLCLARPAFRPVVAEPELKPESAQRIRPVTPEPAFTAVCANT